MPPPLPTRPFADILAAVRHTLGSPPRDPAATISRQTALAQTALAPTALSTPEDAPAPPTFGTLPQLSLAYAVEPSGALSTAALHSNADLVVTGVLGEGGMGRVLLAEQRSLGRDVAVKVAHAMAHARALDAALLTEGLVTGSLEHPSVIPVHALGLDTSGHPMLVMKRIEGVSWRTLLREPEHPFWSKREPSPQARLATHVEVLMSVCNALEFAHTRGFIHRDIKPENVMLGEFGEVYLVDWGIALKKPRAGDREKPWPAQFGGMVGSPAYMAPEMILGDLDFIDERTDVFLLGAALYEVLVGEPPFLRATFEETLRAAFECEPAALPAHVPAELADLVLRAMSRDPARRPQSALAFRRELTEFLQHRASRALSAESATRLGELRELLAGERTIEATRTARELFGECRFGFAQALREWSGNREAQDGLQSCLIAMIELELDQENAEAARSLLGAIAAPPAELLARIEAVERRVRERKDREARLAELERQHDLGVSAGARMTAASLFALLIIGIGIYVSMTSSVEVTNEKTVKIGAVVLGVVVTTVIAARRALLRTLVNRRLSGTMVLTVALIETHRLIGLRFHEPVAASLTTDIAIQALCYAVMGLIALPWAWASAAVALVGVAVMAAMPERVPQLFTLVSLSAAVVTLQFMWRTRGQKEQ